MNERQRKKLTFGLKKFIFEYSSKTITRASLGWIYAISFDRDFLVNNFEYKETNKKKKIKNIKKLKKKKSKINFDPFRQLQSLKTSKEQWKYMKEINLIRNFGVLEDSFKRETDEIALKLARKFISSNERLNILVIGAGCCGLFFSNNLKKKLGKLVNILVCDNRIEESGVREPYSRNWLTNLPKSLFNNKVNRNVTNVFDYFSDGKHIGVTLNMIEMLLLQSCKKNKVKFFFRDDPYDDLIKESCIDFVVDATGGKLYKYYPNHKEKNISLKIPLNQKKDDYLSFILKEKNNYHYPFFQDKQVINCQFKIVGIPEKLYPLITEYIKDNNHDNLFYVWIGKLIKKLNEILIIVNIKEKDIAVFYGLLKKRIPIEEFEQFDKRYKSEIDNRIVGLIKIILNIKNKKDKIYLEPPFSFEPRIKLFNKDLPKYYDKIIIPIGDSYYIGNAKVGNGLGTHLVYIDELNKTITKCVS